MIDDIFNVPLFNGINRVSSEIIAGFPKSTDTDRTPRIVDWRFYLDDSLAARCVEKTRRKVSIYLPIGLYKRLYLLAAVIISPALDDKGLPRFIVSPRDKRDVQGYIPSRLRQIFDHEAPINEKDAEDLLRSYKVRDVDFRLRGDVIGTAIVFVILHELAHIHDGHFEFRQHLQRNPASWISEQTLGSTEADVLEGFEVAADQSAARSLGAWIKAFVRGALSQEHASGVFSSPRKMTRRSKPSNEAMSWALFPHAMALATVISLFDWRNRSLDMRGAGNYPHPVVRWSIITQAIREEFGWNGLLGKLWAAVSEHAGDLVNGRINAGYFAEIDHDRDHGNQLSVLESMLPIAQLIRDQNVIGQSVLFEYIIRSVERGRRLDMMINQFDSSVPLLRMYRGDVSERWALQVERLRQLEQMRREEGPIK